MEEINSEKKRGELEEIYNRTPPMGLIYRIVICGTIGAFLATITVRCVTPNKVPNLVFSSDKNCLF